MTTYELWEWIIVMPLIYLVSWSNRWRNRLVLGKKGLLWIYEGNSKEKYHDFQRIIRIKKNEEVKRQVRIDESQSLTNVYGKHVLFVGHTQIFLLILILCIALSFTWSFFFIRSPLGLPLLWPLYLVIGLKDKSLKSR